MKRVKNQDRKRLSWLDWLLIGLLAVAAVGGFFAVRYVLDQTDGANGECLYTVRVAAVDPMRDRYEELFSVGSAVRSQNGTLRLGEVTEVRREPHRVSYVQEGEIAFAEQIGIYDYYVTIKSASRKRAGDGIRVSDVRMAAGMTLSLRIGDALVEGVQVIFVEWEETEDA